MIGTSDVLRASKSQRCSYRANTDGLVLNLSSGVFRLPGSIDGFVIHS